MDNRRILVLAEYGWRNGGENSLLAVIPELNQNGWEFVFACPGRTELATSLIDYDVQQVDWDVIGKDGARKPQAEIRSEITELLLKHRPAIAHGNSLSTGRLLGPVSAELKIPSIAYLRDIIKLSRQAIDDLNQLDQLVAVSHATRNYHAAGGLHPEKIQVVYNGVDLERFSPREAIGNLHGELGIDRSALLILCIGQIGLRKGTDVVIQSFLKLCEQFEHLQLLIIGMRNSQKQESVEFEQRCHRLGDNSPYARQIHWLGRRNQIDKILNEAVLLLHAARQEPLGRVLLEASSAGCPFIATEVGGTAEIVGDCHPDSILCKVDSVQHMTDLASGILADENKWVSIRQGIRRNATEKFKNSRCADDLNTLYQRLAKPHGIDR